MKTKSKKPGKRTLAAEVTHISNHGIWVLVGEREYLLSFDEYPYFSEAKVTDIQNVELLHGIHLRWNALDVDLALDSLENPAGYPLIYR